MRSRRRQPGAYAILSNSSEIFTDRGDHFRFRANPQNQFNCILKWIRPICLVARLLLSTGFECPISSLKRVESISLEIEIGGLCGRRERVLVRELENKLKRDAEVGGKKNDEAGSGFRRQKRFRFH